VSSIGRAPAPGRARTRRTPHPRTLVAVVALSCALVASAQSGSGPLAPAGAQLAVAGDAARQSLARAQLVALPLALTALSALDLAEQPFVMPLVGHSRVSSGFGWRNISVNGNRFHGGIDFPAASGTPVLAARDGVVVRAGWWGTYGYAVALDHGDGGQTRYAHLSSYRVAVGDVLRQGDVLGAVGSTGASTGPHLHFELRFDERAVDPTPYLESGGYLVGR